MAGRAADARSARRPARAGARAWPRRAGPRSRHARSRTRRQRAAATAPPLDDRIVAVLHMRVLGSPHPRQGRPPDVRSRGAAAARAASRDRAPQSLHRDRLRRARRGPAASRPSGPRRRASRADHAAGRRSSIPPTPASPPADDRQRRGIARLLLDHGANPNDFYMAGDSRVLGAGRRRRRGRTGFAAAAVRGSAVSAPARARRRAVRHPGPLQHALLGQHALVARADLPALARDSDGRPTGTIRPGRCSTWAATGRAPISSSTRR